VARKSIFVLFFLAVLVACSEENQSNGLSTQPEIDSAATKAEEAGVIEEVKIEEPLRDQNGEFDEFKENFLNKTWQFNPSYGVYVGFYKYDDELRIPNGEQRALERVFLATELQALKQFDTTLLSASNAMDLAILEGQIRSQLWQIDVFRSYEWNPASYNPAGSFGVILNTDYKPLTDRLLSISKRLERVPEYYQTAINNVKAPTLEHLALAVQQSKGALNMYAKLIPEKVESSSLEGSQKDTLNANLAAAATSVEAYIDWLTNKKLELEASGEAKPFRIGADLYEQKFAHDIESSYTAEELYNIALKAKDDLHAEMISITEALWPKYFEDQAMPEDKLVAVKQLIDHLSKKHVSRDEFVDEIRRQMPIIQAFMDDNQLLDSDPTRPLVVRLTPEYQRGFAGASVNAPGPYDATANTYYNVSPLDDYTDEQAESYLREYNHWILQILNIHEATPGHYTQLMHANKSPSKIKSIFGNGAMVEGWAVYSERMMLEAGYGDNEPEMWLMYSKWNMRVVVNTILDYSVHVLGMEREEALDLLMNQAFQERTEAEGKWRRVTISQVQLTSYFTGYSEIYALREEFKEKMGEGFDLREFHNKFLSYGSAPVPVIRTAMLADLSSQEPESTTGLDSE